MRDTFTFGSSRDDLLVSPPTMLLQQKERITKRNEQPLAAYLPDPCAGTYGARNPTWVVSRNENILRTVLMPENIDFFLGFIARKLPVVKVLPRVLLEITDEEEGEQHVHIQSNGFRAAAKSVPEGGVGVGMLSYHRDANQIKHRMTLLLKKIDEGNRLYIIDAEGLRNSKSWYKEAFQHLLDNCELEFLDTHKVNFRPEQAAINLLKFEFKLDVEIHSMCREIALVYAIELMLTLQVDKDYLTTFLYVDLLGRDQPPLPCERDSSPSSSVLTFREQAELMLYARALAYGICKLVQAKQPSDVIEKLKLDEDTFQVLRKTVKKK